MANTVINPGNKETVYGGPAPASGGTVYNGVTPNAGAGTVYSPSRQAGAPVPAAAHSGAAKGSGIFFLIAGFSVINTLLLLASSPFVLALGLAATRVSPHAPMATIVVLNVIAVGLFVLLGFFVRQGSKAALLAGMLLYGGDTILLLLSGNPALHIPSIVVHAIFLVSMFKALSQFQD